MRTPLAPVFNVASMGVVAAGGSRETRKLRNADFREHAPTLNIGARGFELWIALALFAALIAHARHVVAVANFLPSTVADFFHLFVFPAL